MSTTVRRFRLAPMSPLILWLTLGLLAAPVAVLMSALFWKLMLVIPGLLLGAIYAWVWLRFRPTSFVVHSGALEVIWPLKRRQLRREVGWAVRVGAGGLWGAFGWLWTQRRGIVQMYVSRTDGFVWIERIRDRPWVITPENSEAFVRALSSKPGAADYPD